MKAYGEWLCSIESNPTLTSLPHGSIEVMYKRDYVVVINLCNGFGHLAEIAMRTIDGAKECYKQFNKLVLEMSSLSEDKKKDVAAQIDANAEILKQEWISVLQKRGIKITDK